MWSASTQNQAPAALLFLYEHVLERPLNRIEGVVRASKPKPPPVVLARAKVAAVFDRLEGVARVVCTLQCGSGLRLLEALQLRVKDLDFGRREVLVRDAKGRKDRVTVLPQALLRPLPDHLRRVRERHETDREAGRGLVPLPDALVRKCPSADRQWGWQWVFPASWRYLDPRTGLRHRHHLHESAVQKAVHQAAQRAGVAKRGLHTRVSSLLCHVSSGGRL